MARRPQYVLAESIHELPTGSHVTPTRARYLNRNTRLALEEQAGGKFDDDYIEQSIFRYPNTFEYWICYTATGFKLIPPQYIKQV